MRHQGSVAANDAKTDVVDLDGAAIAYRAFGATDGTPLLFCHRYCATMDHWDPLLVDAIARSRPVVLFDSAGVGRSTGTVPRSIPEMADIANATVEALGLDAVDVLGWSMGGGVAQHMALQQPHNVRRLVLAGTGPGGVADSPPTPPRVAEIAGKPQADDEDFLYLFFHDTESSRALGAAERFGELVVDFLARP